MWVKLLDGLSDWVLRNNKICRPQDIFSLLMTLAVLNYLPANSENLFKARLGSIGYPIGPEPILGVPYAMGVSTMKEILNKEFEKSWQEAPGINTTANCLRSWQTTNLVRSSLVFSTIKSSER
ncbi:hypothetical protein NQ318_018089 [Aromia moschata]|uniref:Uncharacterized protein n=1 Tax=Aromia moschata TaxID=1265417 RepID=A0AAV8ZEL1_9CUCU|nr:hypothetical protein NQ318_018089 [Aromia moschata]